MIYLAWFAAIVEGRIGVETLDPHAFRAPISRTVEGLHRGVQPRHHLPEIISQHGVVVGQVLLGVVGMAELEAMACARPVVSWFSHRGAYEEFPPFVRAVDGFDIAIAVIKLVDDAAERARLGEASRAWVTKYHNVDTVSGRVERAAEEIIATSQRHQRTG